jgi:hypothetical protein
MHHTGSETYVHFARLLFVCVVCFAIVCLHDGSLDYACEPVPVSRVEPLSFVDPESVVTRTHTHTHSQYKERDFVPITATNCYKHALEVENHHES